MKPIPKSLHAVTVIVKLAKHARGFLVIGDDVDRRSIEWAMEFLGYAELGQDIYGLAEQARKQLKASGK